MAVDDITMIDPDAELHLQPDETESYHTWASCPICFFLFDGMHAFRCGMIHFQFLRVLELTQTDLGHLFCPNCTRDMRTVPRAEGRGMRDPVKCPQCNALDERGKLRIVRFRASEYTYQAVIEGLEAKLERLS